MRNVKIVLSCLMVREIRLLMRENTSREILSHELTNTESCLGGRRWEGEGVFSADLQLVEVLPVEYNILSYLNKRLIKSHFQLC